ncbi:6-phosphogluconolactonase [Kaarinaea lacus]
MHNWNVFDTFDHASKAAADYIAYLIREAIHKKDICNVVLPGGNSPKSCLEYLSGEELPWNKVHWYLGDERCTPIGHADRNDRMLSEFLWTRISATNIHPIPSELGAEAAAESYRKLVDQIDKFDVAFFRAWGRWAYC